MKETIVQPFSNLTEFEWWKNNNCDKCYRYENKSTKLNNARCKHAFRLDLACVSDGMIPLRTAFKIGTKSSCTGLEKDNVGTCVLQDKCKLFNKPLPIRKKAKKKEDINQYNLFKQ